MKIAFIEPYIFRFPRGIERFVVNLAGEFDKAGQEIDILTWTWQNPHVWKELSPRVRLFKVPYVRYFASYVASVYYFLKLLLKKYDMVVISFACYGEAEALALINRIRRQKYCVVFNYPVDYFPHRYREFKRYKLAENSDCLVAVSQFVGKGVQREFDRKCKVISNGVDTSLFHASPELRRLARIELKVDSSAPVLVTLAALEERKGMQWVIGALPLLLNEFPGLLYLILGGGEFRQRLEEQTTRLSLTRHVRFIGETHDVPRYLAAADVGCLLSYGEAMPLTLLEFMSMELPVVSSQHEPFPEFMSLEWGEMVNEQDANAVAKTIGGLLRDGERRQKMGSAGRREVIDRYSWPTIANQYLSLFQKA